MANGLRIGLMGGSFDPAHEGHRYASLLALKRLRLDYVWWLVAPQNPLKGAPAPFDSRLALAARFARHPRIVVSDAERVLGTRYTVDTLEALQRRFPQIRFVWIMGSDNLAGFRRWRRWRAIAARVPVAVVRRPGSTLALLPFLQMRVFRRPGGLVLLDGARNAQSSTALRGALVRPSPPC